MKKFYRFSTLVAGLLLASLVLCAAQSTPQSSPAVQTASVTQTNPPQFSARDNRYHLVPGDVFDLGFDLTPEFNQQALAVQPDGYVTLRSVGDVKVAGMTTEQLRETIRTAYSKVLHDPIISITLKDFQKPYFIADGQLGHPGRYELHGPLTLSEGIALAGGFLETAKHSQVVLYRRVNDQWSSAQLINVKKMENSHDMREDPTLQPGDMLFVPKNRLSKVKPFIPTTNVGMAAYAAQY